MPALFVFEDITDALDDRDIQRLLREISTDTLALALRGASTELADLFKRNMSERQRLNLEDTEALFGHSPQSLSQVEEAQDEIVAAVARLEADFEITVGGPHPPLLPVAGRPYKAPASASATEAHLITMAAEIAGRVRRQGLLALEPDLEKFDLPPLFTRCIQLMIDGLSLEQIREVMDAAFIEQRHALEREQRLLRSAAEMIHHGSLGRHVAEHLGDLLGQPQPQFRSGSAAFVE